MSMKRILGLAEGRLASVPAGRGWRSVLVAAALAGGGSGRADFTAFNDHVARAGTHPNATLYRADGTSSGPMKDIVTGEPLDVVLTVSGSGYRMEGTTGVPAPGTDAFEIFDGYVDFSSGSGSSIALTGNGRYEHTFSGLSAGEVYEFVGTAIRGKSAYVDRWTLVTLEGAEAFTPAHSTGVGVVTDGLPPNQVALWVGTNHEPGQGWVARWTGIDPGPDGTFKIVSSRYTGPTPGVGSGTASGSKSYGLHGIRLRGTVVAGLPRLVNRPASEVRDTSARLGGEVLEIGDSVPEVTLFYGDHDAGADPAGWDHAVALGAQAGAFSVVVNDLRPGTVYYHAIRATNSRGARWALPALSFTAAARPPRVTVRPPADVAFASATLRGEILDTGGETPEVTFFYGQTDGGTTASAWEFSEPIGPQPGAFELEVENLQPNATYHVRARARNSAAETWSPDAVVFATLRLDPPAIVNRPATGVGAVAATLGGTVTATGGESPLVTLFYGTRDGGADPAAWPHRLELGGRSGEFSVVVTGLAPDTLHHFTTRAVNAAGEVWAPASLSFRTAPLAEVLINEFMAANDATPLPGVGAGTFVDWIELHNRTDHAVNLAGWHLTDTANDLTKWTFPAGVAIEPDGYLLLLASGEGRPDGLGNLRTSFTLSKGGEHLALVRPDLTVAHALAAGGRDYPAQMDDISYGLAADDLAEVYFEQPTPGAPNAKDGFSVVADTKFSHHRGFYTRPFEVTITCATPGAVIRYTLDGSPPTESGPGALTYTGPIPISTTTILRAQAFKPGFRPTNVDTQTYLFPEAVARQSRPPGYPTAWGAEPNADYDVDTDVSLNPTYRDRFLEGLRDLPVLSISGPRDDLFGPGGLYANPTDRNLIRAVAAEYFQPAATGEGALAEEGFAVTAGFKIQGGASRNAYKAIKHSLSLRFRSAYGPDTLQYPLFPDSRVRKFNSIHLRAMYNNSWIHSDSNQRRRATMLRDQWMRDSLIAMGNEDGGHGRFVHVFLNGLYWGVYNLHERLENSHYAAWNGGDAADLESYNPAESAPAGFTAMKSAVSSGDWTRIEEQLDVDEYIDWYVMQHFGHNDDLKSNGNWRAAGGGAANAPWHIYLWDSERVLESASNTGNLAKSQDPVGIIDRLDDLEEFRVRFADRLQQHLFHDGALTTERCLERWQRLAAELDRAIVCESARWGDDRPGGATLGNYTRDVEWINEVNRVASEFFGVQEPNRTSYMIDKFLRETWPGQSRHKFLDVPAPAFEVNGRLQHGGRLGPGERWSAVADSGEVWFTTDGSDPRLAGGAVNPTARRWQSPQTLSASGLVRMRAREGARWSPLVEAEFMVYPGPQPGELRLTEINYHPRNPTADELSRAAQRTPALVPGDEDFEFIELQNVTDRWLNLAGVRFTAGIDFTFPNLDLAPGGFVVIGRNAAALQVRYGSGLSVAGEWWGALDNGGERVTLVNDAGEVLADFAYRTGGRWPGRPDGAGSTLEAADPSAPAAEPAHWRASSEVDGSPGAAGLGPDRRVAINEVLTHTDPPLVDAIELHNPGDAPVDLSGWWLSDAVSRLDKFRIPAGTVLAPGGFLLFDEADFNPATGHAITDYAGSTELLVTSPAHGLATGDVITIFGYGGHPAYNATWPVTRRDADRFSIPVRFIDNHPDKGMWVPGRPFALSSRGDDVWLVETDAGKAVRFVDHREFGAAANGRSLGRYVTPDGEEHFTALAAVTLGAPNAGPFVSPVVISEILFQPAPGDFEFVEIHNAGPTPAPLFDPEHPAHTWRIEGAGFSFPPDVTLAPGETVVVAGADPATFRQAMSVPAGVRVLGPTGAPLDNAGERLVLARPDAPDGEVTPYVGMDAVRYAPDAPWPPTAAGGGASLERRDLGGFADTPLNWSASAEVGGTPGVVPGAPEPRLTPKAWLAGFFSAAELADPDLTGDAADGDGDGLATFVEYAFAADPTVPDRAALPQPAVERAEVDGRMDEHLTFVLRRRTDDPGLVYTVEDTSVIAPVPAWSDATGRFREEVLADHGDGTLTVRWIEETPFRSADEARFFRFSVARP